jgi:hypothetical protein
LPRHLNALRAGPSSRAAVVTIWQTEEIGDKEIGDRPRFTGFYANWLGKPWSVPDYLIVTCRLHNIDPYDYLIDVLQRIDRHPAAEVHLLIPRLWKQHFADNPLRSDLHNLRG